MVSVVKRWTHGPTYASFQGHMKFLCLLCRKVGTKKTEITESTSRIALTLGFLRAVTKISRCQVNTTSRRGIKQLGISFGSIFRLFSYESSRGNPRPPPLNDSPGRGKGRKKWNRGKALGSHLFLPPPRPLSSHQGLTPRVPPLCQSSAQTTDWRRNSWLSIPVTRLTYDVSVFYALYTLGCELTAINETCTYWIKVLFRSASCAVHTDSNKSVISFLMNQLIWLLITTVHSLPMAFV